MKELSVEKFKRILPLICDKETSSDPSGWTPENPLWGHCAVVSLIAQSLFGGELLRGSLAEVLGFEKMRSHYWNKLADGTVEDFTKAQFGDRYPNGLQMETRNRGYVLSHAETVKRYKLLAYRLVLATGNGKGIFLDTIYRACFSAALDSPCQKMKFGCVITHNGKVVYEGCNKTIESLKSLCEPKCIRFSITSRTESMIGACAHAEEGMWEVIHQGIPIHECELYVAGLYASGLPWIKEKPEHTCLRCAVQMYHACLKMIHVPVGDRWVGLTPEQALETARAYATKEKSV